MTDNNTEDDVMDLLSVSDNFDMTREEESSLLEEHSMAIDSPLKKQSANRSTNERKPILFDLGESTADDDNEDDDESRDKFRSERKTINYSLNESKREIPDSLGGRGRRPNRRDENLSDVYRRVKGTDPTFKRSKGRPNRRRNRFRDGQQFGGQSSSHCPGVNRGIDLRQLINTVKQSNNIPNAQLNPFLQNQSLGLSPLMDYQLKLGIINQTTAQNQLIVNALLAQSVANPLLNRLSIGGQTSAFNCVKPKDNFQITVVNENKVSSGLTHSTKTQTKPQIRCRVTDVDTTDSTTDCDITDSIPPMRQPSQKPQLSTLFSKHLATKASQRAQPQSTSVSGGDLFGDALAEVEVGVDNDYLRRMEEQEKKRLEIQKLKELRRLEMADERLESALQLKQKIGNQRNH